jgi:hypothetical protein
MTDKITQSEVMTDGQLKAIKRLLEDGINSFNSTELVTLGFSKEEAQEILKKGDLIQEEMKATLIALLKKYAIIDPRYGSSIAEFDVTVPMDYKHETYIDQESKQAKKLKTTYYYNDDLSSKNFASATTKLVPGKTYHVKIFPILTTITSEDNMNFLKRQRAILVGGQGLMLAQNQHKDKFPKGKWTVSFDQKDALWKDASGDHRVPYVYASSDGDFRFNLGYFEDDWSDDRCLLCFCD